MFWDVWLSILAGATTAIARFVVGTLSVLLAQPQVATPATVPLLNKLVMLDAQYASYVGAIQMFHYHNHPMLVCATHRLLELGAARKLQLEEGVSQAQLEQAARRRSHRMVLLLLIKHPFLQKYRKAAIAAKRAEEEARAAAAAVLQQQEVVSNAQPDSDELLIRNVIELWESTASKLRQNLPMLAGLPTGSKE